MQRKNNIHLARALVQVYSRQGGKICYSRGSMEERTVALTLSCGDLSVSFDL